MKTRISDIIVSFTDDIIRVVREVLSSNLMINDKTGSNTIIDSNIYRNVRVDGNDDFIFNLYLNDYLEYIESGRRPNSKFPPVEPIVRWARSRGIPTDNSTIFLIRRAIARDGIKPRPFVSQIFDDIDDIWENGWSDELYDRITEQLNDFFNKNG